jgi:hypothetical protein
MPVGRAEEPGAALRAGVLGRRNATKRLRSDTNPTACAVGAVRPRPAPTSVHELGIAPADFFFWVGLGGDFGFSRGKVRGCAFGPGRSRGARYPYYATEPQANVQTAGRGHTALESRVRVCSQRRLPSSLDVAAEWLESSVAIRVTWMAF